MEEETVNCDAAEQTHKIEKEQHACGLKIHDGRLRIIQKVKYGTKRENKKMYVNDIRHT